MGRDRKAKRERLDAVLSLRLSVEEFVRFTELTRREDRSSSHVLRRMVRTFLKPAPRRHGLKRKADGNES